MNAAKFRPVCRAPAAPLGRPRAVIRRSRRPGRARRAFSLVEITVVLAALSLLTMLVAPGLMQQLAEVERRQEIETLSQIAQGLREHVLSNRRLPAVATLPADVAGTLGWTVERVQQTRSGQNRAFLYDPALRIGATTAATLPYVQTTSGADTLSGVRLVIVSTAGTPLPAVLYDPGTNAATVFGLLWSAPDNRTAPPGWTWGGEWRDILIQRVNLQSLFTRVVLNNQYYRFGRYSVDNTNAPVALTNSSFAAWFLGRTVLGLHGHDTGPLQSVQVVPSPDGANRDPAYSWFPSYVYEQGVWRGRLFMSTPLPRRSGNDLQAAYEIFMSGPPNVYKVGSVTQASVTWAMYNFMSNYVVWADSGFSSAAKVNLNLWQSTMAAQVTTYCNKKASAK